jgi:PhzF family phenazine biosynthesis protein
VKIYQVDAFSDQPFKGNPAAVCVLSEPKDNEWLQSVAAEMNLSETAFLWEDSGFKYDLRWFTPTVEVDLCGHATLASAHVLWEIGHVHNHRQITFNTRSGMLKASTDGKWIELDFPSEPAVRSSAPEALVRALNIEPLYTGKNRFDYIVEVASEEIVRKMSPNFTLLASVSCRGVIVTSVSSSGEYDFVSRFFAPASGVNEDPVTGSAHCCLAPYWRTKLNKTEFTAYQASKRGGFLRVCLKNNRTLIAGKAVTVLIGELLDS